MKKLILLNLCLLSLVLSACSKDSSRESGVGSATAANNAAVTPPQATVPAPIKAEPTTQGGSANSCNPGPIGTYNGYIKGTQGSFVPLSLTLDFRQSMDSTTPLRATMRVGFLGGVSIGTETIEYRLADKYLTVTFATAGSTSSSAAAPSVQIIGTLDCGTLVNGQIHGNKSGFQDIVLSKSEKSLFDDSKKQFSYGLTFASHPQTAGAYLVLTPRAAGVTSSDTSDLPYLPSLTAAVQFPGVAATVQTFDQTLYDPLTGTLEMTYLGYSIFKCPVVVNDRNGELTAPTFTCDVTMGSKTVDQVTAVSSSGSPALKPPKYFKGIYYPSPTQPYFAVASLEYQEKDLKNPIASIFPNFPVLDLKITVCDKGSGAVIIRATFETQSLNPISSKSDFRFIKLAGESFDLNVTYGPNFQTFTGEVQSAQTSPGAQNAKFVFTALADQSTWRTCATP